MSIAATPDELSRLMEKLRLPPGVQCEFVSAETEQRSVGWAAGAPDNQSVSRSNAAAVRVIDNGGQGLVKGTEITAENAQEMTDRALLIARSTPKDPHRGLGQPAPLLGTPPENDEHVFERPATAILEELKELEERALKTSPRLKKVVRLLLAEERERKTIVTNQGVSLQMFSTGTSFLVELLAEEAGETEVAWDGIGRRFGSDINKEKVALESAEVAVSSLGGKALDSGLYTVLLHPRVGTQLLSLLSQALSAEAVQNGRSFLRGQLEKSVAASGLSVLDDPGLIRGAASVLCDDEGTPANLLTLIDKGTLRNYFYDLRTGRRGDRASNGRGFRSALSAAPAPHATNLYIAPGKASFSDLAGAEKKVFLLHDIMGLHMAEPVTGEFSLGAAGFLYKGGKFSHAVRGMTMAGTVGGLLKNVAAVGNEVHWTSSLGAPYMLVNGITLSGN